jgi:hypothetical protein
MIFGIVVAILQTLRSFKKTGVIIVFTGPFESISDMLRTFSYDKWTRQRLDLFLHSDVNATSANLVGFIN